jgi:hypothetical protein
MDDEALYSIERRILLIERLVSAIASAGSMYLFTSFVSELEFLGSWVHHWTHGGVCGISLFAGMIRYWDVWRGSSKRRYILGE